MAKLIETAFKAYCEQKRNSNFGNDTFLDSRTSLQNYQLHFINQKFKVVDILDNYYCEPHLIYIVKTQCNRILRFTITQIGTYTFKTVPFFGGNNTPYFKPITLKKTISCHNQNNLIL